MRIHKYTILITTLVCLICFLLSFLLEFNFIFTEHNSFYSNVSLGIFASGVLVILTSMVSFLNEKRKYYKSVFFEISQMIICSRALIEGMKNKDQNLKSSIFLSEINSKYDIVKIYMWEYTYFFKRNRKDLVVDSVMVVMTKVLSLQNVIVDLSNQLKSGKVNMATYEHCFETLTEEFVNTYAPQLSCCQEEVQNIINGLVKDRKLKTIFDENNNETHPQL